MYLLATRTRHAIGGLRWPLGIALTVAALFVQGWPEAVAQSPSPESLASDVQVSVRVTDTSLAVTHAISDSLETGIRRVRVRIVDDLGIEFRIQSQAGITLAVPPRLCLVGPYWAPDDAGLSDRCWGDPDLTGVVAAALPTDDAGRIHVTPGEPIMVETVIHRGTERCDYPAGEWQLEVTLAPIVDDDPSEPVSLPDTPFHVPWRTTDPLPEMPVGTTRYCGLASAVVRDQGEPPSPAPSASP